MKRVAVIGLGRVGLPLGLVLADAGYDVVGIDSDVLRVQQIRACVPPFIESNLLNLMRKVVGGKFTAATSYEGVADSDYIIITVGTPVDDNLNPVLADLDRVIEQSASYFHPGQTVILRSTVSPGTTRRTGKRIADLVNVRLDEEFYVAFCPERIAEGKAIDEIRTIPQIVGGIGPNSTERARWLFDSIEIETLPADALSAELAKLFSNMYRYINFAIANEFMMLAHSFGREYETVRKLVNHNYSRGGLASAGLTAGPCLYKDGFFLLDQVPFSDLIGTSWRINENLPNFLVAAIERRLTVEGRTVALLGMAFKGDIDDTRQSLSFRFKKILESRGAVVLPHDPLVEKYRSQALGEVIAQASVVVVATPHSFYRESLVSALSCVHSVTVCDVWNLCGTGQLVFESDEVINIGAAGRRIV